MISKTFLTAASMCGFAFSFALMAFAGGEKPHCNQGQTLTPAMQSDDPLSLSGPQFTPVTDACADSIAGCDDPVKHIGTQNGCACFACGYGTAKQHSICTRDPKDKESLFKRAR